MGYEKRRCGGGENGYGSDGRNDNDNEIQRPRERNERAPTTRTNAMPRRRPRWLSHPVRGTSSGARGWGRGRKVLTLLSEA